MNLLSESERERCWDDAAIEAAVLGERGIQEYFRHRYAYVQALSVNTFENWLLEYDRWRLVHGFLPSPEEVGRFARWCDLLMGACGMGFVEPPDE